LNIFFWRILPKALVETLPTVWQQCKRCIKLRKETQRAATFDLNEEIGSLIKKRRRNRIIRIAIAL